MSSVVDRYPVPFFDADPDPNFPVDADPDPGPHYHQMMQILMRILS